MWSVLSSNTGLHGESLVTDHLSHDIACHNEVSQSVSDVSVYTFHIALSEVCEILHNLSLAVNVILHVNIYEM